MKFLPTSSVPTRKPLRNLDAPDLSAFSPISASGYFSQAISVKLEARGIEVRAYYSPPVVKPGQDADEPTTVLVCHHGAGLVE